MLVEAWICVCDMLFIDGVLLDVLSHTYYFSISGEALAIESAYHFPMHAGKQLYAPFRPPDLIPTWRNGGRYCT